MPEIKTREYLIKYTVAGARGVDAQKTVHAANVKTALTTFGEMVGGKLEPEVTRVYELKAIGSTTTVRKNSIKSV